MLHSAVQHFQQERPAQPLETSAGVSLLALLQQLQLRHPRPSFEDPASKQRGQCRCPAARRWARRLL